jgi:hypothetical protein
MRGFVLGALLAGLVGWAAFARAEEPKSIGDRIADLERRVAAIEAQLKVPSALAATPSAAELAAVEAACRLIDRAGTGELPLGASFDRLLTVEQTVALRTLSESLVAGRYGPAWSSPNLQLELELLFLRVHLSAAKGELRNASRRDAIWAAAGKITDALRRQDWKTADDGFAAADDVWPKTK